MQIQSPDDYNHSFAEAEGEAVIQLIVVVGRAMRSAIKSKMLTLCCNVLPCKCYILMNVELNKTCTVQLLRCNNGGAQDANLQLRPTPTLRCAIESDAVYIHLVKHKYH